MIGRGHRLLRGSLGRAHQVFVTVTGLMVMMVMMVVSGHVTGRGRVVQLRVQLQRRRYHGRMMAVVTAARLFVTVRRLMTDGHHVVRGPAGSGR